MSRERSQLSRERIAAAALAIADREGFQAVSMRRVAQALEVGTMSLYYYVKTRDDLLAVMDDALMSEVILPSLPKDWRRALTQIATRTHAIFVRHPWALVSMQSAPPGIHAFRHMEQCLQALSATSMTPRRKLAMLAMIDDFVFGHALREAASDKPVDMEFATAQLASGNFPRLAEIFADSRVQPGKDRFQTGLRLLLNEETRTRRPSPTRKPKLKSDRRRS